MISCVIKRKNNSISHVNISGHSGYHDIGKDIVCAAVSVISVSTLNGLLTIAEIDLSYKINEDGFLEFTIPIIDEGKQKIQVDAIAETFYLGIKSIELDYGEYIEVIEMEVE